jgi:hypothetical protein
MDAKQFRAELVKIMPGYSWTVHRQHSKSALKMTATGTQSSGSNRLSTLQAERIELEGVWYVVRSAGYGLRAPWLHEVQDRTLARALRGLQDHYERQAASYRTHAEYLQSARTEVAHG